jgi:hypothetical protein
MPVYISHGEYYIVHINQLYQEAKDKILPVHILKVCGTPVIKAAFVPNLGTRSKWMVKLTPWSLYPYLPIEQKAGWAPESVWAFWKKDKAIPKSVSSSR